jgi:radical SAM protein with 4Fe4S-binding SPASM domain
MADSHQFKLGNALNSSFDEALWARLASRTEHLHTSCQACPYRLSCQGGCMSEAIHHKGDPFEKTEYCTLWKALFAEIDITIDRYEPRQIAAWLRFIDVSNQPRA